MGDVCALGKRQAPNCSRCTLVHDPGSAIHRIPPVHRAQMVEVVRDVFNRSEPSHSCLLSAYSLLNILLTALPNSLPITVQLLV